MYLHCTFLLGHTIGHTVCTVYLTTHVFIKCSSVKSMILVYDIDIMLYIVEKSFFQSKNTDEVQIVESTQVDYFTPLRICILDSIHA